MSVLLEFSLFPLDQGESLSDPVSQVIALIRDSGVPFQLTSMGTIFETDDLAQALALVERCHKRLQAAGCHRVYATIKLDIRDGAADRMAGKVRSIEQRIGPLHD